jgi:transcriptional regulator with XRE-family HTH domain
MSLFSDNIRHLRVKKGFSQEIVAESLLISRASLAKYESGTNQAPYETLVRISHYYHVSIDLLLTADIRKINMDQLLKLDDNRILLPIVVDKAGDNVIEIVPHKAKAGYMTGYSDPEYIESLQYISLPMLKGGKYRAFEVDGDSMPPFKTGTYIVGKYVENAKELKKGKTYLVMTTEGMTYKRLKDIREEYLVLDSDNELYQSFEVPYGQILQLWEFGGYFGTEELSTVDLSTQSTRDILVDLRKEFRDYIRQNKKG